MKKLIVLLTIFFMFSFNSTDNPEMKLKAIKITPIDANNCTVQLELHNESNRKINFLSMYCSDSGFYVTDNPDIVVTPKPCTKNFPTSVPILRNSFRTATLELKMLKTKKAKFKIGFKFIEIPKDIPLAEFDSSKVKGISVWSNTIEFKGN